MDHYRHLTSYIPSTRGSRVTDTYVFIPTKFDLPENTAADRTTTALEEFVAAFNDPQTKLIPFLMSGINKAINVLSDMLTPK